MATFKYTALDQKGKETTGTITAANPTEAKAKIRDKGLFPSSVVADDGKKRKKTGKAKKTGMQKELRMPAFMTRVKPKQLMEFTRQLAILIQAGLPLTRALQVLHRQQHNQLLAKATGQMIEQIESGQSFAESLAQHPRIFNRLYINMIKAGEIGGVLDVVLDRLAEFMEKTQKMKSKIASSMVYPLVVLSVAVGIVYFLMTFIIPRFEQIFADLMGNQGLPMLTQFVMNLSKNLTSNIVPTIIVIAVVIALFKILAKTKAGRNLLDHVKFKIPLFGQLNKLSQIARFARTLGTLMTSGVPVLQALMIVRETAGNAVMEKAIIDIHDAVKEGENMAPPVENSGVFPPMVISMVEVGEETGELPEMLIRVADAFDEQVDNTVTALTSVIEPLLIVTLAIVVGTIVIALFLPLISIIGSMSG